MKFQAANEAPAHAASVRLFHLTFYKCGSQWVRDILSDPRIEEQSDHRLVAGGIDLQAEPWPELKPGELAAPLYTSGAEEWTLRSAPGDRAFVVIRDPRDIVVSLVYSVSLSHVPSAVTRLLREPISDACPAHRVRIGMFLLAQWADYLRTWKDARDRSDVLLARYEALIADLPGEMRRLFDFLQWDVPDGVLRAVAEDNAFENRAGRNRGDENEFSHRRKAIAGDWRNHFDRALGQLFENAFPGLLTDLGYEENNGWWRTLQSSVPVAKIDPDRQRSRLLAVLEEHENELAAVRLAADERLRDVERLHVQLREQASAADERLADILSREMARQELESSVAWRCGFRPLRAIASLFRK